MNNIPESAVEAAAEALRTDNCVCDVYDYPACTCLSWDREAEVALKAALPCIRKELAAEIMDCYNDPDLSRLADRYAGYYQGKIAGLWEAAQAVLKGRENS